MNPDQLAQYRDLIARGEPVPFEYLGRTFLLNPEAAALYHLTNSLSKMLRMVNHIPQEAMTIVDVGANCGLFAAFAALRSPGAQVLAFEPAPELWPYLHHNVEGLNVQVDHRAVSDSDGTATLYVNPVSQQTNSLIREAVEVFEEGAPLTQQEVQTTTLERALPNHGLTHADVLKVDVQGFEGAVFRGAKDVLPHVEMLFVESTWLDLESTVQVLPFARHYGFTHGAVINAVHMGADLLLTRHPVQGDAEVTFTLEETGTTWF